MKDNNSEFPQKPIWQEIDELVTVVAGHVKNGSYCNQNRLVKDNKENERPLRRLLKLISKAARERTVQPEKI